LKLYAHVTMAALAAVIVFGVAGGGAAVTSSFPTTAAYADSENGKGWPKTVWYLPKSQEGPPA
jgi:hypothetical protein